MAPWTAMSPSKSPDKGSEPRNSRRLARKQRDHEAREAAADAEAAEWMRMLVPPTADDSAPVGRGRDRAAMADPVVEPSIRPAGRDLGRLDPRDAFRTEVRDLPRPEPTETFRPDADETADARELTAREVTAWELPAPETTTPPRVVPPRNPMTD